VRKRFIMWSAVSSFILMAIIACTLGSRQGETFSGGAGGFAEPAEEFAFDEAAEQELFIEEEAPAAPADALRAGEFDGANFGDDSDIIVEPESQEQQQERLIIRNGTLELEVDDTLETQQSIESIVAQYAGQGAFVVSSNQSGGGGNQMPVITLSVRVPVGAFDTIMDEIADLAVEVNYRNETGQDVTAEYVDLTARIESLETARDRLLEIIEEAQTTEDLLLAEQQLTQREAEIESLKGRAQYLSESAQLSSITVTLYPYILSQPVDNRWRPLVTIRRAFEDLIENMQDFIDFLIYFIISLLPFLLIFGAIIYGVVRAVLAFVRRRRARRASDQMMGTYDDEDETT